jgi:outer membrane lipoprotein carrier protein
VARRCAVLQIVVLLVMAFTVGTISFGGGQNPPPGPARTDVEAIVRRVEERYQAAKTLKATFLQRRSEGKRVHEIEAGTVYFRRPGRMRWEYESPETKLFVSDGKWVWFYVPSDRTVTRAKVKEADDARVPLAFLTGKARLGRFCRRVELADAHVLAPGNVALRCLPKPSGSGFHDAIVEVTSEYALARIIVREPGDIETEFRFGNWEENLPLSEALFRFQAPPGVAIVDGSTAEALGP